MFTGQDSKAKSQIFRADGWNDSNQGEKALKNPWTEIKMRNKG